MNEAFIMLKSIFLILIVSLIIASIFPILNTALGYNQKSLINSTISDLEDNLINELKSLYRNGGLEINRNNTPINTNELYINLRTNEDYTSLEEFSYKDRPYYLHLRKKSINRFIDDLYFKVTTTEEEVSFDEEIKVSFIKK